MKGKICGRRKAPLRESFFFKELGKVFFKRMSSNQLFYLHKTSDTALKHANISSFRKIFPCIISHEKNFCVSHTSERKIGTFNYKTIKKEQSLQFWINCSLFYYSLSLFEGFAADGVHCTVDVNVCRGCQVLKINGFAAVRNRQC